MDGKKLRISEYKSLMRSRRQDVRKLWYEDEDGARHGSAMDAMAPLTGAPDGMLPQDGATGPVLNNDHCKY